MRGGGDPVAYLRRYADSYRSGHLKDVTASGAVGGRLGDGRLPLHAVLDALPAAAATERVGRVAVRCQTEFTAAYQRLIGRGYRVHWTDLRMLLPAHPPPAAGEGVVMSNWEI